MTLEHRILWQTPDADIESRAMRIWRDYGVLPDDASAEARAGQLAVVALEDGEIAGMTTSWIVDYRPLRRKFAFFRIFVVPDFRASGVMVPLVVSTFDCLETWSRENPQEDVAGFGSVRENPVLNGPDYQTPFTPTIRAMLVGYDKLDRPVRIKWFSHTRV